MDPLNAKLVAAATGSTLTALTMTPFDVVKTRLQTQPVSRELPFSKSFSSNACCQNSVPCVRNMSYLAARQLPEEIVCVWHNGVIQRERVTGFLDAVRHVVRAEGIGGLWKGAGTSLVIGVPSSTAYMLTYDYLAHQALPAYLPATIAPLVSGIVARSSIATIASPLELLRTNLQSTPLHPDHPHTLRSVIVSLRQCVHEQGLSCLWRGVIPTLWRDVPFSGIYWAGYESIKKRLNRRGHQGAGVAFVSGASSGILAALITTPFDVLKTRRQALIMSHSRGPISTLPLLATILREEGYTALFAGLMPRIVKIAPACGIMIASFEGIGKLLQAPELD
ncbi:mitochondrial carrier [Fistulina hepatica ATCC 64428]|uniref:Mitochondrial carrier n=1 Tax=Fistulina hepatica ATCC 64428 TaxID=1128425 RepID=A0A0D7A8H2_9AGAR|nr:mitochondrial carrier [Fistulina hepatica ATCC 64428]